MKNSFKDLVNKFIVYGGVVTGSVGTGLTIMSYSKQQKDSKFFEEVVRRNQEVLDAVKKNDRVLHKVSDSQDQSTDKLEFVIEKYPNLVEEYGKKCKITSEHFNKVKEYYETEYLSVIAKGEAEKLTGVISKLKELTDTAINSGEDVTMFGDGVGGAKKIVDVIVKQMESQIKVSSSNEECVKSIFNFVGDNGNSFFSELFSFSHRPTTRILSFDFNYEYFDTLGVVEKLVYTNLLVGIAFLLSLITITSYLFGDQIIEYFNLRNKGPVLRKILKYREKMKIFSLSLNIFLMFIAAFCLISINLLFILLLT